MPAGNATFVANGNITPSRFVKIDATADSRVIQCSATTDISVGISQQGTRNPPYSTLNDGFCAIAGENLRVFQQAEIAVLEAGAAITRGARLRSDASGRGVTAATAEPGLAIALQSASGAGALIEVVVVYDTIGAS